MLKRLYLANGTLQTPLSIKAEDISVDAGLAAYLLTQIFVGDWAYLALAYDGRTEVIKVYTDYSGLGVARAQDGTTRQAFPAGTSVIYSLTQVEIQDATPAAPIILYANGADPLTVNGSDPQWVINYPLIVPQYEGGIKAYFTANDGVLHLEDWYPAAGCLDIAGNGAPLIGGPYFYLTSRPYAIEVIEQYVTANPITDLNKRSTFGPTGFWSLTQPSITDEFVQSGASIGGMNVFGSVGSFSVTDQYVAAKAGTVNSINVFGGEKSASINDIGYVSSNAYVLQMLLYGSEVTYNFGVDKYVGATAIINSISVA